MNRARAEARIRKPIDLDQWIAPPAVSVEAVKTHTSDKTSNGTNINEIAEISYCVRNFIPAIEWFTPAFLLGLLMSLINFSLLKIGHRRFCVVPIHSTKPSSTRSPSGLCLDVEGRIVRSRARDSALGTRAPSLDPEQRFCGSFWLETLQGDFISPDQTMARAVLAVRASRVLKAVVPKSRRPPMGCSR